MCTPGTGVVSWGVSPLYEFGSLKELIIPNDFSNWQSTRLDEGNCVRAIDRGEEACECVVKLTNRRHRCRNFVVGRIFVKAARLRTETSYKAGLARRAATTQRSRSQIADLVNDELVQRNITLSSGEACKAACESSFAPTSRACPKGWNAVEQFSAGDIQPRS